MSYSCLVAATICLCRSLEAVVRRVEFPSVLRSIDLPGTSRAQLVGTDSGIYHSTSPWKSLKLNLGARTTFQIERREDSMGAGKQQIEAGRIS